MFTSTQTTYRSCSSVLLGFSLGGRDYSYPILQVRKLRPRAAKPLVPGHIWEGLRFGARAHGYVLRGGQAKPNNSWLELPRCVLKDQFCNSVMINAVPLVGQIKGQE